MKISQTKSEFFANIIHIFDKIRSKTEIVSTVLRLNWMISEIMVKKMKLRRYFWKVLDELT